MNTQTLRKFLILFAALFSNMSFAQTSIESRLTHGVELTFLAGDLNQDLNDDQIINEDAKQVELSYNYSFGNRWYLGFAYIEGENGRLSPAGNLFRQEKLNYEAFSLSTGYRYFYSSKQHLYAELSVLDANTHLQLSGSPDITDDNIGWGFETGWQYQLKNGLGFKLGLEKLELTNKLTITGVKGGISYAF